MTDSTELLCLDGLRRAAEQFVWWTDDMVYTKRKTHLIMVGD